MTTATQNPDVSREVAKTIVAQLGNMALSMLGAHTLVAGNFDVDGGKLPGLRFFIKGSSVRTILITLNGSDLYDVKFSNRKFEVVATEENVHFESLHAVIESNTGLYTRL